MQIHVSWQISVPFTCTRDDYSKSLAGFFKNEPNIAKTVIEWKEAKR